ncbi:MAG: hypothetical protein Q8R96_19200 [Bacteroidota bacterium]|nr:hypothetical protein [Bacteroidota bacterium]
MRYDTYPEFLASETSLSSNYITLKGTSLGVIVSYKHPLSKSQSLFIKSGIGYYQYSFNKMKNRNTRFGNSERRLINFPSPLFIPFFTDKYWYNTISANIGIEKLFYWKKDLQISIGANINNYYTYSQYYHITYENPNTQINNDYKNKIRRNFGLSANLSASLLKKLGKISLGPAIIIPVYDRWKTDETFTDEAESDSRNKFLRGIGLGISCNYSLTTKNKL